MSTTLAETVDMFKSEQYRAKAAEYQELGKQTDAVNEILEFKTLERSYTMMADNEELLQSNFEKTVQAPVGDHSADEGLASEEERVLRCLGAAVILQWNTLPKNSNESCSTMQEPWVICCRPKHSGRRSRASCINTKMTRASGIRRRYPEACLRMVPRAGSTTATAIFNLRFNQNDQ